MLKKITFKIILLLILLIVFNLIYTKWFYEMDIQKHSKIINLVREIPDSSDIIYIGESSNTTFRGDDLDKRPISAFIGDHFPKLNTYDITKPGSHAGIYKVLLEHIPNNNNVKTIVVTLNLRSFNAQWIHSKLETPLQKSLVLIKPYPPLLNRFLLSFKAYDIKTEEERTQEFKAKWKKDEFHLPYDFVFKNVIEWDRWVFHNGIKDKNGTLDTDRTELACHYIKTYAFQLEVLNNPRISDFDDIVDLAHQRKWNLVFNLLAENIEKADELVGEDLIYLINQNAQILEDYYKRKGVLVVNNLNLVKNEQFIDQDWTTEHYAEKGRKIIAKNVAEGLKNWHSDFYKEMNYEEKYQTNFFNNCDQGVIWGQMHTLTKELAFSGEQSSKIGNGNDYSITLEYPLKVIPDSIKNNVEIEFWAFQTAMNQDSKIVIQANGEAIDYYWKEYNLNHNLTEINKWVKYHRIIPIPGSIKQAGLMKIYVYNPSKETIYIDDFKINITD